MYICWNNPRSASKDHGAFKGKITPNTNAIKPILSYRVPFNVAYHTLVRTYHDLKHNANPIAFLYLVCEKKPKFLQISLIVRLGFQFIGKTSILFLEHGSKYFMVIIMKMWAEKICQLWVATHPLGYQQEENRWEAKLMRDFAERWLGKGGGCFSLTTSKEIDAIEKK